MFLPILTSEVKRKIANGSDLHTEDGVSVDTYLLYSSSFPNKKGFFRWQNERTMCYVPLSALKGKEFTPLYVWVASFKNLSPIPEKWFQKSLFLRNMAESQDVGTPLSLPITYLEYLGLISLVPNKIEKIAIQAKMGFEGLEKKVKKIAKFDFDRHKIRKLPEYLQKVYFQNIVPNFTDWNSFPEYRWCKKVSENSFGGCLETAQRLVPLLPHLNTVVLKGEGCSTLECWLTSLPQIVNIESNYRIKWKLFHMKTNTLSLKGMVFEEEDLEVLLLLNPNLQEIKGSLYSENYVSSLEKLLLIPRVKLSIYSNEKLDFVEGYSVKFVEECHGRYCYDVCKL